MKKKLIAFLIVVLMVIALVPTTVFAENEVMGADITVNSKPPAPPDPTEKFTVKHHGANGQGQGGDHGDIKVSYYEPGSSDPNPKLLSDDDKASYDYHAGWILQIDFVADQGWKYLRHVENEGGPLETNPRTITTNECINYSIHPQWRKLVFYEVSFDSMGGSQVDSQTVPDGGKVTKPTDPTKTGYAFSGWYYKQGDQKIDWNFDNQVKGDITLYARWTEQHTVTFNSTGGSSVDSQTVPDGGKATKPADPTKAGFSFSGWYYMQGSKKIDWDFSTNTVTDNITLYARWIEQHTVTFDSRGGSPVDSQTVPDGGKVTKPADPTKAGFAFDGWYYYKQSNQKIDWNFDNQVKGDITLYARWIEQHTVTFDSRGGSSVESQTVPDGGKVTKPADPTRTGFTFDGWYYKQGGKEIDWNFGNQVKGDIKLYARWIEQHTVTFDSRGGSSVESQTVPDGGKVTKPANPSKEGYVFDCWLYKISKNTYLPWNFDQYPVKGDITLYASWIEMHTVAFDSQGGSPVDSQTVPDGGKVTKPANPTKTGYTFDGWYYNHCGQQKVWNFGYDKVHGNLTLIAKWAANGYIVKYNINGGDGGVTADSSHKYDIESNLTANGYYKAGHTFAGWATSAEGSSAEYTDGESVKNLTDADGATVHLYAVWNINQFDVTFYEHDGKTQIGDTQTIAWNTAADLETAPEITGYAFDKWVLTGDDKDEIDSLAHVKENIRAVASYIKNGYTVTFLDYNGTVLGTDGVLYGEAAIAPEKTPAREGYTFTGWDKAFDNVTSNLTVTAQYAINTYTVKFVDFDGKELSVQKVNWGAAASAPASPTFTGYTFTGWDKAFDKVISDLTVTAQYAINKYTVKFVDFDGKELSVQTVNWNSAAIAPANPIRTGYTFTSWDKAFDNVTSDLTVTAQYAINTYTVKFVDFDGKELSVQKVNWNAAAIAPATPTFTGFTFARWDKAFDKVTSDLTVTAQYAINKYTVKFVDFDGKELSVQTVNWNSAAIAPASPTRTGYTFTGWDKAFASITSDLTVTAQYKQNVSIDDEGVPKTYDDSQAFPWWWIVAAVALIGAIVWIIAAQARKHKSTGDAV